MDIPERYEMYKLPEMETIHTLIPTPREIVYTSTEQQRLDGWVVVRSTDFPNEVQYLSSMLISIKYVDQQLFSILCIHLLSNVEMIKSFHIARKS